MTREEQIDWLCRLKADLNNGVIFTPWNKEFIEALTSILDQKPCEDAISRREVLEIQAKYAEHIGATKFWQMRDDIKALLPVTPQPCSDAISRQEVLEQTYKWSKDEFLRIAKPFYYLSKKINSLSPVNPQPQPKTGHWTNGDPICPCCGEDKFKDLDADIWSDWQPKYCPNCGARMTKPRESEDKE